MYEKLSVTSLQLFMEVIKGHVDLKKQVNLEEERRANGQIWRRRDKAYTDGTV